MLRFDQLVIAVRDLDAAMAMFRDQLGFDVRPGGRHEGFGTHNAIIRFSLDYIELIAVEDEAVAIRTSRGALVRYFQQSDMGPCAYALATDQHSPGDCSFQAGTRTSKSGHSSFGGISLIRNALLSRLPVIIQMEPAVLQVSVSAYTTATALETGTSPRSKIYPVAVELEQPETFSTAGPRQVVIQVAGLDWTREALRYRSAGLAGSDDGERLEQVDGPMGRRIAFLVATSPPLARGSWRSGLTVQSGPTTMPESGVIEVRP